MKRVSRIAAGARRAGRADSAEQAVLITGGAGFIGTNLARRLAEEGRTVLVYDNLSRPGVERNARWLLSRYPDRVELLVADVRDAATLAAAVDRAEAVFHFAAQVAVTSSVADPTHDFDVNARGTLNVLEAVRRQKRPPPLIFTSTNKVYGALADLELARVGERYQPLDARARQRGIDESRPLDFHSPYGCSKGCADQYVLDYARTWDLPALVFRMSCIYGPHQWGNEDQGWVAHFLIRALAGEPIVLYGDGHQVRDLLFVEDLVDAFCLAERRMDVLRGRAYNIGGGPANASSLLELIALIGRLRGEEPEIRKSAWRPGDQRYYVSNTSRFAGAADWAASTSVFDGVARLHDWLRGALVPEPAEAALEAMR
jgi:CDP-paratose 2-epimerase